MKLNSTWRPYISSGNGPIYRRLARALSEDILSGELSPGARLPAHRDLSYRLSLSIGTVTKAYALLERQGLVFSERGRGTFTTSKIPVVTDTVSLHINLPPNVVSNLLLSNSLQALSKKINAASFGSDTPSQGKQEQRVLFANWLQKFCPQIAMDNMILCNSAQSAILHALARFDASKYCMATNNLPYPPIREMAEWRGFGLTGLNTDNEGILPDALDAAAQIAAENDKELFVFTNHSPHNPTGKVMSRGRVKELAQVCEARGVWVIEDDVYTIYSERNRVSFLELLPDQTFHVTGVSKILTPGLRLGFLTAPAACVGSVAKQVELSGSSASPIACLLLAQWIENGMASDIVALALEEAKMRARVAQDILGKSFPKAQTCGLHSFLPMPYEAAEKFAATAADSNIIVTPPAKPINGDLSESGIRICLGAVTRDQLTYALEKLAAT